MRERPLVVLDTNMLLVPLQFGVDVFDEVQRLVPGARMAVVRGTLEELDRIASRGGRDARYARLAKRMILLKNLEVLDMNGPVDPALVELAKRGAIIATNDRLLKRRVWAVGARVIALRDRGHLELF